MGTPKDSEKTRIKLIEAAGRLFAERGYAAVTVREIVADADTHLSAMNYHFGSKGELYKAVVEAACMPDRITEAEQAALRKVEPETALRMMIVETEKAYRKKEGTQWRSKLLARESRDPSPAFADASEIYYKPLAAFMAELIGAVTGKTADDMQVRFSVILLWAVFDSVFEYSHLVETVAPGLLRYLGKEKHFADVLYDMVIHVAGRAVN